MEQRADQVVAFYASMAKFASKAAVGNADLGVQGKLIMMRQD